MLWVYLLELKNIIDLWQKWLNKMMLKQKKDRKLIKKLQREGFQKPVVKGAYVQDCVFIGEDKLDQLASIKTKEELIGDIIALLQSPIQRVIGGLENASEGKGEDEKVYSGAPAAAEAPAAEAPAAEAAPAE